MNSTLKSALLFFAGATVMLPPVALAQVNGARLVGVMSRSEEKTKKLASQFGVPHFTDLTLMPRRGAVHCLHSHRRRG